MEKAQPSEQETPIFAELFVLAHLQLRSIQRQLGPGTGYWQRRTFRSRHQRIRRKLATLLDGKGCEREAAEKLLEQNLEFIGGGKKGWGYISSGEIEYVQGLLKGLE